MRFLCVGYGSIGKLHSGVLREMGHEVVTFDPRLNAGADCVENPWSEKLGGFDGVLDCTPSDVRAGWKYNTKCRFIEKPLGKLPEYFTDKPTIMGFCYYWLPSLYEFVVALADVRIFSLSIVGGQWLPVWHSDVDYRSRYHGTPGRGGVVLDSLPHSLFIARWILGNIQIAGSVTGKFGGLDIRTEDTAAVLLRAETGQPCFLHASYLRVPRAFYIEAETSNGVKRWDFDPAEADVMYRRQMEVFCQIVKGKRQYGFPDLAEGIAIQELLDEIKNA